MSSKDEIVVIRLNSPKKLPKVILGCVPDA